MTSDLETHLGYWLRFVSNHVSHAFSLKLQARDVTVAEWVVLRELFDPANGTSLPELLARRRPPQLALPAALTTVAAAVLTFA